MPPVAPLTAHPKNSSARSLATGAGAVRDNGGVFPAADGAQPQLVIFDLDGTLTDSAQGIVSSFCHALTTIGAEVPDGDLAGRIVGPPMHHTLAGMGLGDRADEAIAAYRADYTSRGWSMNSVYLGVPELLTDLRAARAVVPMPAIRKDFMLDPWQIVESRAMGADCVLLILACLTDAEASELERVATSLGMDVLAEVHDGEELDRALKLHTRLIGINNRNLKTLKTDIATTEVLAPLVPSNRVVVGESGLKTHDDLTRLARIGVMRFLVGESLMRQDDVAAATRALLGS